jgi:integrase
VAVSADQVRYKEGNPFDAKGVRDLSPEGLVATGAAPAVPGLNDGRSRSECNRRVSLIKRIMKWAVSEELVPPAVYQAVASVPGLQRGRTTARETVPVGPVDDAVVDATLPFLNRHVRGLVEFQRLTGCRPGEACSVRRSDIDTGGHLWLYRPHRHKNAYRGLTRTIVLGPIPRPGDRSGPSPGPRRT